MRENALLPLPGLGAQGEGWSTQRQVGVHK